MRYLPIFLDLKRGVVLLAGSGDLARAKLRLLTSAGARVRWYATGLAMGTVVILAIALFVH